jgi:hypothetical protein
MSEKAKQTSTLFPGSVFLVIILSFGLFMFLKANYSQPDKKTSSSPIETFVNLSNAIISPGIPTESCQQSWIANKGNFRLLTFDKTQFTDNKKIDQRIVLIENIHKNLLRQPISFFLCYKFPHEKDDPLVLS